MQQILDKAKKTRIVIFDVDGVLTDGRLYITESGEEIKAFHSRDGHGMKMLQSTGIEIGIITGRTSNIVSHRMGELGIKHVYQGRRDKLPAFQELLTKLNLSADETVFVGDDVVDLPIMVRAGLSVAVSDAHPLVKQYAHWQTNNPGGKGAARDVCELIMQAHGTLENQMKKYTD